jgi:two-component sensor histidine kinase
VTLGLVTNEFVTNSLKCAFDDGGTIGIELGRTDDGLISLALCDNGRGIPAEAPRGSGMDLIEALARPVCRELKWSEGPGARLSLQVAPPAA